jgi:poly-beta-1,6-N-acetyl-D-glucosamine synthase
LSEDEDRVIGSPLTKRWSYAEAKALDETLAYAFFLVEVLIASVGLVALVAATVLFAPAVLASNARLAMGWSVPHDIFEFYQGLVLVLVVTASLDYVLTCLVAVALRRPSLFLYGVGFLGLRFVDATAILWTLPMAWITQSSGRWTSPARRPTIGVTPAQPQHPHGQGRSV